MASIENLPFEVIERILLHISKFSVLDLTTVSKQFSDVIFGSVHLMNYVCLHWGLLRKSDIDKVLKSNRKYRCIHVIGVDAEKEEKLLEFIQKNAKTLKKMTLCVNEFQVGTVQKIIEMVGGSLVELEMELKIHNFPEVAAFEVPNLKSFHYMHEYDEPLGHLMAFLKKLKHLEVLYLENCTINEQDLKIIIATGVRKMTFENCSFEWIGKLTLIQNHRLEELTMSVEKKNSFVDEYVLQKIVKACPRLTTLKVEWWTIGFETALVLALNAKNLKTLRAEFCVIEPITFPTVECYETFGGCIESSIKLIRVNRQLKQVKIDHLAEQERCFRKALLENPSLEVEFV